MLPTPEQSTWLKEYYRMWSRYHLAIKLGISEKQLGEWLTLLGLKKKKDAKKTTLTDTQKEFITANYKKMKHQEIADEIGVTAGAVQRYCYYKRLYKTAAKYKPPPTPVLPCNKVDKAFERVKGKYDNESTIDKYLNME